MDTIPQELIHAIVGEIDDLQSLQMCSLVSSIFREDCQRILLRSLKLGGEEGFTGSATWALLQESPYIAPYFTLLKCVLPDVDMSDAELNGLCAVLDNLSNVRDYYLVGGTIDLHPWSDLPPRLSLAIIKFLQRQPLSYCHIISMGALPTAVLSGFLGAAPTLSFVDSSVSDTDAIIEHPPPPTTVENLLVIASPTIVDFMTSPPFVCTVANIRKLWVEPDSEFGGKLISLVAHNLEHLRLECTDDSAKSLISTLPPLPCLQSAELGLDFHEGTLWLIPAISSLLEATPETLREIRVAYSEFLPAATMTRMDGILSNSSRFLRVHWRLDVLNIPDVLFSEHVTSLQQGMPRLHGQGRLLVTGYSFSAEGLSTWSLPN